MRNTSVLHARAGQDDGYRDDLPLMHDLTGPVVVDARALRGPCHPMFLLRLRIFIDWHMSFGRDVSILGPTEALCAQQLCAMGTFDGLPSTVFAGQSPTGTRPSDAILGVQRLGSHHDVEDVAPLATEVLERQTPALAAWGDPVHMAVSELCGNAIQHGRSDVLPAYVAADRVDGNHRTFRLAIADLGIGIPEHVRGQHPEWHNDTAAITRALVRGVTGTKDRYRGNGFDEALDRQLVRTQSAVGLDIRAGKGHVKVQLVDGRQDVQPGDAQRARRGTWITYTVTTI